jgi:hypothetical protein
MSDTSNVGMYACHGVENDVATLLLTDPLYNDRLRQVFGSQ